MAVTSSTPTTADAGAYWLSPEELHVLEAVCDTLLPALEPPPGSAADLAAYYRRKASDLHVGLLVAETLGQEHAQAREQFRQLLRLMSSPVLSVTLAGATRPFAALSQEQRERYLLAMANSPLGQLRQGYQTIKRLATFIFYSAPDEQGVNPNWAAIDYTPPSPPPQAAQPITPFAITQDTTLEADVVVSGDKQDALWALLQRFPRGCPWWEQSGEKRCAIGDRIVDGTRQFIVFIGNDGVQVEGVRGLPIAGDGDQSPGRVRAREGQFHADVPRFIVSVQPASDSRNEDV